MRNQIDIELISPRRVRKKDRNEIDQLVIKIQYVKKERERKKNKLALLRFLFLNQLWAEPPSSLSPSLPHNHSTPSTTTTNDVYDVELHSKKKRERERKSTIHQPKKEMKQLSLSFSLYFRMKSTNFKLNNTRSWTQKYINIKAMTSIEFYHIKNLYIYIFETII